jgi:ATP-dependent protease ClpP protease subunit
MPKTAYAVPKASKRKVGAAPKASIEDSRLGRFLNIADPDHGRSWYRILGKSADGKETEIEIMEEIGMWGITAKDFRNSIKRLGEKEPLHVHINSDGGDILEGNEIYNTLRDHKGPVRVSVGAIAASMASVIAMSGKPLSIAENGFMMIHNPWTIAMGDAEEMRKNAETMDKMKAGIIAAYRQKSNLSDDDISALMDDETWMTADEALEKGFVDSIDKFEESAKNFNLSKFRNSAKFLSRLQKQHHTKARERARQDGGNADVTLEDLENAIGAKTEPTQNQNQKAKMKVKNLIFFKGDDGGGSGGGGSPEITPEMKAQLEKAAKDKAEELYQARLKCDQEIDEIVAVAKKRDKRDFSAKASEFKKQGKTADEFAIFVAKSKPEDFEVIGAGAENDESGESSGIEVEGIRGLVKGTVGERFISSDAFKSLRDLWQRGGKKLPKNTAISLDVNGLTSGKFMGAAGEPTSTGLTSIEKVPSVRGVLGLRRLTIRDLIPATPTNATTVRYIREVSFANEADMVAEAAAKPEGLFEFAEVDAPVRKIAVYTKQPDEFVSDYAGVAAYVNNRLTYKVERKEEDELLNGSGSGQHLTGLLNMSGIQTQAKGTDTRADAIFKAMTNVQFGSGLAEGGWEVDGVILNPLDWENLRLAKDGNGQYYGGGPFTAAYGNGVIVMMNTLWGKPCVITPAIAAGTALVGAFREATEIRDRQGLTVEMTNSDQDDFIKNRITIRVERREALLGYIPTALCQVTGL